MRIIPGTGSVGAPCSLLIVSAGKPDIEKYGVSSGARYNTEFSGDWCGSVVGL